MAIGWLDPAIDSKNAGDQIISTAVRRELRTIAGDITVHRLPTQRKWTKQERLSAADCKLFVVGGTNLLTSSPIRYRQWKFGFLDARALNHRCILLGVGWWQYQGPPDFAGRALMQHVLVPGVAHGVRDGFTKKQLEDVGLTAINIGCPTIWNAPTSGESSNHFRGRILTTVTDYNRDRRSDAMMLQRLRDRSTTLEVWPQGSGDARYVRSLGFGENLIDAGLKSLKTALQEPQVDYVGTRLHAGIMALTFGIPAVIIEVDNRAKEMAADIGFWSIDRKQIRGLDEYLNGLSSWHLELPERQISAWRFGVSRLIRDYHREPS